VPEAGWVARKDSVPSFRSDCINELHTPSSMCTRLRAHAFDSVGLRLIRSKCTSIRSWNVIICSRNAVITVEMQQCLFGEPDSASQTFVSSEDAVVNRCLNRVY
jgi:hypothetical protein